VVDLEIARKVPLIPVVLEVSLEEHIKRLQSDERIGKKLTDPAELKSYFAVDSLQYPAVAELLVLDTTSLEPDEAVVRIEEHISVARPSLKPANRNLLQLR
jgi:hypothetical protein